MRSQDAAGNHDAGVTGDWSDVNSPHSQLPAVDGQIDYAHALNPQQYAAVTAEPGPALVIAGAGAGKTRTLTYRVAFLLEQGVQPENILLLTFTNKAAREMMGRVIELLGRSLDSLWGGTFHSVGNRILRTHAELLGYRRDFTILDRQDATDLVSACLKESGIDVKATRFPKPDVLCEIFSLAASMCLTTPEVLDRHFRHFEPLADPIETLRSAYAERKRQQGVMDFDDLLGLWLRLLLEHEDVRQHYQRRFQCLLVDEYQDTNQVQSDLIDLLAARHHNVMAVGDDSQSIYSWRGANFRNIMRFPERHAGAKIYKIETNYRSTPEILALANAAIAPNVHQFDKVLAPVRPSGSRPILVPCEDARVQAAFVANRVLDLHEAGLAFDRMAVLYRSHFHAMELQMELTARRIPFSIASGLRFFEQAHIKDVAAFLKLTCNRRDETAFKRLVRMLPGIGLRAAERLWLRFLAATPAPPSGDTPPDGGLRADGAAPAETGLAADLQRLAEIVPRKSAVAWAQFSATVAQIQGPDIRDRPAAMIRLVVEALYQDYLEETYANYRSRLEDLEQLAAYGEQFASTAEFLTQLALLTNVEAEAESAAGANEARLRLSTVHQAKGLEFDAVFVPMLCEGLFPSVRAAETPEGEEEERRLFYVALTRAKNELYLSYPLMRSTAGGRGAVFLEPSRFVRGLPPDLIEELDLGAGTPF